MSKFTRFWGDQTDPKSACGGLNSILRTGLHALLTTSMFAKCQMQQCKMQQCLASQIRWVAFTKWTQSALSSLSSCLQRNWGQMRKIGFYGILEFPVLQYNGCEKNRNENYERKNIIWIAKNKTKVVRIECTNPWSFLKKSFLLSSGDLFRREEVFS